MKVGVVSGHEAGMIEDAVRIAIPLRERGVDVVLDEFIGQERGESGEPLEHMDVDLLLVVGSDRTLLYTLLRLGSREVPILPVASRGQPDFLFDVTADNFSSVADDIVQRRWSVDRRSRIVATISGKQTPPVLNEIGVFAKRSATLITYSLTIDGERVWKDSADGVIVTTPTGSTAYAMSVGGPVILNSARVVAIVPVNSGNPMRRPLIVPDTTRIGVGEISPRTAVEAVLDGQIRRPIRDRAIEIMRSPHDALVVKLTDERVAMLQGKLQRKTQTPESVPHDLPPSAKLVLKVLEYQDSMTQSEIVEETKLPARTVRHALSTLISEGLVTRRVSLRDSRQSIFAIARSGTTSTAGEVYIDE
ncbi:MAG: MarR family transcriptional regulator [Candidatus Thorarchaeota archaeon]